VRCDGTWTWLSLLVGEERIVQMPSFVAPDV
jgi:hypothetical protein